MQRLFDLYNSLPFSLWYWDGNPNPLQETIKLKINNDYDKLSFEVSQEQFKNLGVGTEIRFIKNDDSIDESEKGLFGKVISFTYPFCKVKRGDKYFIFVGEYYEDYGVYYFEEL
jgi:hypothetical protein